MSTNERGQDVGIIKMTDTNKHDNEQEKSLDEVRGKLAQNKANYKGYNQSQHRDPR